MPGFVSLVPGFVSWLSGFVSWLLGFVCWVLEIVFWVLGIVCWVLGIVYRQGFHVTNPKDFSSKPRGSCHRRPAKLLLSMPMHGIARHLWNSVPA